MFDFFIKSAFEMCKGSNNSPIFLCYLIYKLIFCDLSSNPHCIFGKGIYCKRATDRFCKTGDAPRHLFEYFGQFLKYSKT